MQFSANTGNKNKLFKLGCFISYIKPDDKHFYLACEQCKKKVIENIEKTYSCENCGKVFQNCNPTYMMTVKIQDHTGELYVSISNKNADPIIGMQCQDFKDMKENSEQK